VLAAPVNAAPAVMADPQIQSREYFVAIRARCRREHLYPGAVARMPETPLRADAPAPLLGEHNRAGLRGDYLGMTDDEVAGARAQRRDRIASASIWRSIICRFVENTKLSVEIKRGTFHVNVRKGVIRL